MATLARVSSVAELRQKRLHDCRLTSDRKLDTLDEAEAFLVDRGVLTLTQDSALPSLFAATDEDRRPQGRARPRGARAPQGAREARERGGCRFSRHCGR